ncbi:MAG: hypothetical protein V1901_03860 [Patescibacteria group bacterium]
MAQAHSNKIKQIYDKVNQDNNEIEKLKEIKINSFSINFSKERKDYIVDWQLLSLNTNTAIVKLLNFPESFISNLRVVCIFRTSDGFINSQEYQDYKPSYNYIIREKENKYEVMLYITNFYLVPIEYKIIIASTNLKDCYEVRTKKI